MIRLIEVTQDDIENGVQGDCDKCAIALVLFYFVSFYYLSIILNVNGFTVSIYKFSSSTYVSSNNSMKCSTSCC